MYSNSPRINQAAHQAGFGAQAVPAYPQPGVTTHNNAQPQADFPDRGGYPQYNQPANQYPQAGAATQTDKKRSFLQVTAYGAKSAAQCEPSISQSGWFTVSFDVAKKTSTNPADRTYNWKAKLSLQLTQTELPFFIAFAFGLLPSIRFDNHGDAGKWIEIVLQEKGYFLKVGSNQKDSLHAVPVGFAEVAMFGAIALKQYARNFEITPDAALEGIKMMANLAYRANSYPGVKSPSGQR